MGKSIEITCFRDTGNDPAVVERMYAFEGRLPRYGEVWVLFRRPDGVIADGSFSIFSREGDIVVTERVAKAVVERFSDESVASAEIFYREPLYL